MRQPSWMPQATSGCMQVVYHNLDVIFQHLYLTKRGGQPQTAMGIRSQPQQSFGYQSSVQQGSSMPAMQQGSYGMGAPMIGSLFEQCKVAVTEIVKGATERGIGREDIVTALSIRFQAGVIAQTVDDLLQTGVVFQGSMDGLFHCL
jgi:Replication protein A C terminal